MVVKSMQLPIAGARQRGIQLFVPPPTAPPMFARMLRPRYDRLVAVAALLFVVAIYGFGALVVREVARADMQVQAARAEYELAGAHHHH
jgi:hypothetical protein